MTLTERLADAHQRSVSAYLRRQQLEAQRQQYVNACSQCDLELVRLDGEIAALQTLVTEEQQANRGE